MICSRFNKAFLLLSLSLSLSLSKCVSTKCGDSERREKERKFGPASCLARFFQVFRVLDFFSREGKKRIKSSNLHKTTTLSLFGGRLEMVLTLR
jgi:hypothetical protein